MRDIKEIYRELRDIDLVETQDEFSTNFLGKSPRYYSYLLATDRQPSIGASYALAVRLEIIAEQLCEKGNAAWAERFEDLARVVEENARKMALDMVPYTRRKGFRKGKE